MLISRLQADIGKPLALLPSFIAHDYELDEKGNDSYVVTIHSLDQLIEAINSDNLIVTYWHGKNEQQSKHLLQTTAAHYKKKISCFSVNLLETPLFSEHLFPIISNVLVKYKVLHSEESAISKNLLTILTSLAQLQKGNNAIEPFFLFFKKGMLLINDTISFREDLQLKKIVEELISLKSLHVLS